MQDFKTSKTKENLMRAFAGESQARNRYTFAGQQAKQQKLFAVADLFKFTANQEKAHAEIFYNHLKEEAGQTIHIDGGYPVDISENVCELLSMAHHNEYEEFGDVYPAFSEVARQEGFHKIAQDFANIAKIEKAHGDRFDAFGKLMKENKLFSCDSSETWVCLNCGYIMEGTSAPQNCPVCGVPQGYYIRLSMASWGLNCQSCN
ncbi:MAG: rubrerythrin family protein [Ruminococcus sp.]|nr:rubrerythrin family protein [Ruminococcus sp.]